MALAVLQLGLTVCGVAVVLTVAVVWNAVSLTAEAIQAMRKALP